MLTSLSIVVPAFNEESSIGATIEEALETGRQVATVVEVIVCNDGSTDATADVVRKHPAATLIDRKQNRGIEASIRELYRAARHEWVFLNSADRQWPMSVLHPMAAAAATADFVVGVRNNKREVYTPYRQVISWGYERAVKALGAPGADPGSIKLARRELLDRPVVAKGVFAEGERIIRAARAGARIVEVPVEFHRRSRGKATGGRPQLVARAIVDVGRVASSLAFGWPRL